MWYFASTPAVYHLITIHKTMLEISGAIQTEAVIQAAFPA
jgi:hypothetical protein